MKNASDRRSRKTPPKARDESAHSGRHTLIGGRYRVEKPLGKGGMASVWAVVDETNGGKLALKRLSKAANQKIVALFEREFHTLASLHSPCIVKAYDYAKDAEGPFYTMELLEGSDVSSLAPMPWQEVARVLRDIASGLTLLHARRVVHRDLSARNVWRTPEGRVKLIDFGTMCTFGKPAELVGTPPFIAPESLHSLELDQRTDLYALGALGYFLLTGRHAYPARSLPELEAVWREQPRSLSKRVAELAREDLQGLPDTFEALVSALLSRDPLARPTTAADVIDRLTVIASLEPVEQDRVLDSYLRSAAFVGRAPERDALRRALSLALSGRATSVVVQSAPGLGRTRLLAEFALEARLSGAVVLQAEGSGNPGTHDVAKEYALRLLDALPGEALAAAAPYATTLGHLSPGLRDRLGVSTSQLAVMPQAHGEARMRVQTALRDWFLDVARERRIVLVADDLDLFDEGSSAWLGALGREAVSHRLLIVASLMYYANRGNIEQFERYRQRVEVHAIQRGTAWQVETWTYSGLVTVYVRTGDAARLKECVERLKRESTNMPSLRFAYARALGAYLVVRGTPTEALKVLGQGERPMGLVGWCRGEGMRARAFNALGEHERAKETCLAALGHLTPADLQYSALNLGVQLELARAEAGLGNLDLAERQLHALLKKHGAGGNPLTIGALHEALAELAALRGDEAAFTDSVDEVGRRFRETMDPALVARHERLARLSRAHAVRHSSRAPRTRSSRPPRVMTVLHRLRHGGDHTPSGSARWALKQVSELTGSREGYLFLTNGDELACAARIGEVDDERAVAAWVRDRMASLRAEAALETRTTDGPVAATTMDVDDRVYRLTVLASPGESGDEMLGAFAVTGPGVVPSPVLETIVERLRASDEPNVADGTLSDGTLTHA